VEAEEICYAENHEEYGDETENAFVPVEEEVVE